MRVDDAMCRSRVAALYLPLVGIVIEALPQLYGYQSEEEVAFNSHVAMAIATSSVSSRFTVTSDESRPDFQSQVLKSNVSGSRMESEIVIRLLKVKFGPFLSGSTPNGHEKPKI